MPFGADATDEATAWLSLRRRARMARLGLSWPLASAREALARLRHFRLSPAGPRVAGAMM
jgi:hypothetical protein